MLRKTLMTLAIAGGVLALAACASQPQSASRSNQQKTTAQNQKVVCFAGMPLGSHIRQTHCVTMTVKQYKAYKKQRARTQAQRRQDLQRVERRGQVGLCPSGSC